MDEFESTDHAFGLAEQEHFWKQTLGGELPKVGLPIDYLRPPTETFVREREILELDEDKVKGLEVMCFREGFRPFVVLMTVLKALLARYNDITDVIVGSVSFDSARQTKASDEVFANPVVLRTSLQGNPSVREMLVRVDSTIEDVSKHRDYPFDELVEWARADTTPNQAPFFQVMFVAGAGILGISKTERKKNNIYEAERQAARCDLILKCSKNNNCLKLTCDYKPEMFDSSKIHRLLGHYSTLLEAVVSDPERRLWDLPLLTEAERHQQLVEWNATGTDFFRESCLHELFETQADRTSDAVALVCEGEHLTYAELNRRSNQLGFYLRDHGVGPDKVVGMFFERTADLVLGILGILKAGGTYLPLDPSYPEERLRFMLVDSQATVVLTVSGLADRLGGETLERIKLDEDWEEIERAGGDGAVSPATGVVPSNTAYVIYTSGSTGRPKGTKVTHENVTRLFRSSEEWFHFGPGDVWTLFHSYTFDFSVWELWGAVLYGARLMVIPFDVSRSPEMFFGLVTRERVTVLNQTPSAFRQFARVEHQTETGLEETALRLVILGGEAIEVGDLRSWLERGPGSPRLINGYGITETTVFVTFHSLLAEDLSTRRQGSPIGRSIPDLQVYVLDRYQNPVPIGIPGEIHIGGAGLSRGYLDRTTLTSEKFIPHPFGEASGARFYRSGDLGCFHPDGQLEYLGRIDDQVQIRGFRVELGEVQSALVGHEGIREAVVVFRSEGELEGFLVGYIVPKSAPGPTVMELRRYLSGKLPDYMVPAAYVILEKIPLTAHGKVDYRSLPLKGTDRALLGEEYVAPRTALERMLAEIWAEAVNTDRVGVFDNFFVLGGDSMTAIQAGTRIREILQIDLSPDVLFQKPTVNELASDLLSDPEKSERVEKIAELFLQVQMLSEDKIDSEMKRRQHPSTRAPKDEQGH